MAPTDRPIDELHVPVLRDRIVDLLAPALSRPGAVHVDGTLGMAGHALAVLEAFPQARLVGIDRDPQALDVARERLSAHADRIEDWLAQTEVDVLALQETKTKDETFPFELFEFLG